MASTLSCSLLTSSVILSLVSFPTHAEIINVGSGLGCAGSQSDAELDCFGTAGIKDADLPTMLLQIMKQAHIMESRSVSLNRLAPEGNNSKPVHANAAAYVSEKGVDFVAAQVATLLTEKLNGTVLLRSASFNVDNPFFDTQVELSNLTGTDVNGPAVVKIAANHTEDGFHVVVGLDITATGDVSMDQPKTEGKVTVGTSAVLDVDLSISVDQGKFSIKASSIRIGRLELNPDAHLTCTRSTLWDSITCAWIEGLNRKFPDAVLKSIENAVTCQLEERASSVINDQLANFAAGMPTQLPLPYNHGLTLQITPVDVARLGGVEGISMQIGVSDRKAAQTQAPEVQLPTDATFDSSMFALSLTSSIPNSFFASMFDEGFLEYTIEPSMVPGDSPIQLDTNAIGATFRAPWLQTEYARSCPESSPCSVEANVQSSEAPTLQLDSPASLVAPIFVDFFVLYDGAKRDFLWRVNTTLTAAAQPSIAAGSSSCQQLAKMSVQEFSIDGIEVTKTKDPFLVSFPETLYSALPRFVNRVLLPKANEAGATGIALNPITLGGSNFTLRGTSAMVSNGVLQLRTDLMSTDKCTD